MRDGDSIWTDDTLVLTGTLSHWLPKIEAPGQLDGRCFWPDPYGSFVTALYGRFDAAGFPFSTAEEQLSVSLDLPVVVTASP